MEIETLRDYYRNNFPIYDYIGLEIVEATPISAMCSVPLKPDNINHFGTVHAAVQWAVCETLGGVIYLTNLGLSSKFLGVVKSMDISFIQPATTALLSSTSVDESELVRVSKELESSGKSDFLLPIVLKDEQNRVVASARGTYHLRDRALFRGL